MSISPTRRARTDERLEGSTLNVVLSHVDVAALDAWIAAQKAPRPTRPEAVRILVEQALGLLRGRESIRPQDLTSQNDG